MREISLHILDIVQNSISANADNISIEIFERNELNLFQVNIEDDGKGMCEEFLKEVLSPFKTSRTTRKVGLGLSLFKHACELCEGDFEISSKLGVGTKVVAKMKRSHIDRMPLGDISSTIASLVSMNEQIDFKYIHKIDNNEFTFDTKDIKEILGDVRLNELSVIKWIREYIKENEKELSK